MPRVKRGQIHLKKRKKLFKLTKGYHWGRKNILKLAKEASMKAGAYSFRDRRAKKRDFRKKWQVAINTTLREYNEKLSYSKFINALKTNHIELDRKVLAEMAEKHTDAFHALLKQINL